MNTSDIVKNIAFGNYEIAKNVINHVLLSKTAIALDEKKKEVAKKMYCEECDNINEFITPVAKILSHSPKASSLIQKGLSKTKELIGKENKLKSLRNNDKKSKNFSGDAGPTGMTATEMEE